MASFVLGILWIFWLGSILAVICGHLAVAQIKRTGAAGKGLAIAGLVLGYIGLATAILAGVLAVAISGGDDTRTTSPGGGGQQDAQTSGAIGTPVRDGRFEFTVTRTSTREQVGDQYLSKQSQGQFVLVHVTVKNVGDQAQSFSGSDQKLFDSAGNQYSADDEAAAYLQDSTSLYEQINPGNQVQGVVLFDVPQDTTPASIELHDSAFSSGVTVSLK
ncbi:DUF4352 domain-containing protein [Actinomadura sp. 21ATH]|uniref:DUF4352 domain-containing protein n=1 Tax=Actinomadura sp. 21ATH TaxID=1735444 RepID=UPI0035C1C93A